MEHQTETKEKEDQSPVKIRSKVSERMIFQERNRVNISPEPQLEVKSKIDLDCWQHWKVLQKELMELIID